MPPPLDIAAFAGSLRGTSYNRGLLRAAVELAPAEVSVEILDLMAVPLFNQDFEGDGLPATVANLRERVETLTVCSSPLLSTTTRSLECWAMRLIGCHDGPDQPAPR